MKDLKDVLAENESLQAQVATLTAGNKELSDSVAAVTAERDQAKTDLASITAERDQAKTDLASITAERDQAKTDLAAEKATVAELKAKDRDLETAVAARVALLGISNLRAADPVAGKEGATAPEAKGLNRVALAIEAQLARTGIAAHLPKPLSR